MGPEYWLLKKQYYERFNAMPVPDAPEKLPVLTAEELQTIRTKNGAMCERALQYCANKERRNAHDDRGDGTVCPPRRQGRGTVAPITAAG
jgi:hypothetical protein